jgi:serine/threonine protein kinase
MTGPTDTPPPERLRALDADCDDFEAAWQKGQRPLIEHQLDKVAPDVRLLLLEELIRTELEWRCRLGEQPSAEEYRSRFPAQDGELTAWLAEALRSVGPSSGETASWGFRSPETEAGGVSPVAGETPRTLGEYELLERLGAGGMGEVYKARHRRLDKLVAVKLLGERLQGSGVGLARFLREMKAAGALEHPNVVEAIDAGEQDGVVYLVMKLVAGTDLARLVRARGPLPIAEACDAARQAALGLHYLHERGLIHRDVKASNLMRTPDGTVKILDLGLARWREVRSSGEELTCAEAVMGTPDFLAPEQIGLAQTVGVAADLYGLGGTLFHLLTGKAPFAHRAGRDAKLRAHQSEEAPDVRTLRQETPQALADLVRRLLAKNPQDRPPGAAAVAAELAVFVPAALSQASTGTPPQPAPPSRRKRWLPWAVAASAALLVLALAVAFHRDWPKTRAPDLPAPLRVERLEITHFTTLPGFDARQGVLGRDSFAAGIRRANKGTVVRDASKARGMTMRARRLALIPVLTDGVALAPRGRHPGGRGSCRAEDLASGEGKTSWRTRLPDGVAFVPQGRHPGGRGSRRAEGLTPGPGKASWRTRLSARQEPRPPGNQTPSSGTWMSAGLVLALACALLDGAAPPAVKPAWQRYLTGGDARKAARLEKEQARLEAAGRFAEALKAAQALADVRATVQGADHWQAIDARHAVAALRQVQKQGGAARKEYAAIAALQSQADALVGKGGYRDAQPLLEKILAIRRKVLGEEHPATATSYNNLAANQNPQGRYAQAEEDCRKALAIHRKRLGEDHPHTAASYDNLAANQADQGRYADAEDNWQKAAERFEKARGRIASSGLDRSARTSELSPLLHLAAVLARNGKPAAAWRRFEQSLGRGTWDDLSARLRRPPAERDKQSALVARLEQLDRLLERTFSLEKPGEDLLRQRRELLSRQRQAQEELNALQAGLEKRYGPVAGQVFDRAAVQAALPPDDALLAWIDIPGKARAKDPNGEHWAVLLRSAGAPVFVPLPRTGASGAWSAADARLPAELRAALQSDRGRWRPLAQRLRRQRLTPLEQHLKATGRLPAVRRLIVLPSPALAGAPVEVFAEGFTVSYAHSGTLYAHLRRQAAPKGKGLLALGDPVFDLPAAKEPPLPRRGAAQGGAARIPRGAGGPACQRRAAPLRRQGPDQGRRPRRRPGRRRPGAPRRPRLARRRDVHAAGAAGQTRGRPGRRTGPPGAGRAAPPRPPVGRARGRRGPMEPPARHARRGRGAGAPLRQGARTAAAVRLAGQRATPLPAGPAGRAGPLPLRPPGDARRGGQPPAAPLRGDPRTRRPARCGHAARRRPAALRWPADRPGGAGGLAPGQRAGDAVGLPDGPGPIRRRRGLRRLRPGAAAERQPGGVPEPVEGGRRGHRPAHGTLLPEPPGQTSGSEGALAQGGGAGRGEAVAAALAAAAGGAAAGGLDQGGGAGQGPQGAAAPAGAAWGRRGEGGSALRPPLLLGRLRPHRRRTLTAAGVQHEPETFARAIDGRLRSRG